MKMFNLINIGERSGSGVPNIFNTWNDQGWKEPVIEERFDPDRTTLTLEFIKKTRKKTSKEDKIGNKTRTNMLKIEKYLQENGESKTNTIAEHLGLSLARTRKILSQMDSLEAIGTNTNRRYRLKNNSN
jgi:ATP-dependent DNA helicase RecG